MPNSRLTLFALVAIAGLGSLRAQEAAEPFAGTGPAVFDRARYFPVAQHESALVGGKFEGSNLSPYDGFVILGTITESPPPARWSELNFPNTQPYRWIRYLAPNGSHAMVAELEFYSGRKKLTGIDTYGSNTLGRAWYAAFDRNPSTRFESEVADGQFAAIDLGDKATTRSPTLRPPPTEVKIGDSVSLSCSTPGARIRFTLDGSLPSAENGSDYTGPIRIAGLTTVEAVSLKEGLAPSPPSVETYLVRPGLSTFHVGNSLTNVTSQFKVYARTAGFAHTSGRYTLGGALTNRLWNTSTTTQKAIWEDAFGGLDSLDDFTLQPRDFNLAEEEDYDLRFLNVVRQRFPHYQPWLYAEWTYRTRQRPPELGLVPSTQLRQTLPAQTWEEAMGATLLYVEDLASRLRRSYRGEKPVRVLPSNLALGWIHRLIEEGQVPGIPPDGFYQTLFRDMVHTNKKGSYLVDATWFAAFYRESPEGKFLPVGTDLTLEQAKIMQRLAWEVVKNYPDCGLYEEGATAAFAPQISLPSKSLSAITPIFLTSATPGAWFRYTLDGTPPTRTRGYIYCGVISVPPGKTLKAVAYKSGWADSPVSEVTYPAAPGYVAPALPSASKPEQADAILN